MSILLDYLKQLNLLNLKKGPLLKKQTKGLKNYAGRNNSGKITVRHKGGGHKKKYRKINFNNKSFTGICCNIEYDPNRNSYIAATYDFEKRAFYYILAPKNLKIGDILRINLTGVPRLGHSMYMLNIPSGSYIYNIPTQRTKLAKFSRSAGSFSKLKEKTLNFAIIELSSTKHYILKSKQYASIGIVSNELDFLTQLTKAGQSRWLNKRPSVRGVAMNPIDHPHGGGEGKKSGRNKTPWGVPNWTKHWIMYEKKTLKI